MDIVTSIERPEYLILLQNPNKNDGKLITTKNYVTMSKRKLKKLKVGNKVYFRLGSRIVGYAKIGDFGSLNDLGNMSWHGGTWRYSGCIQICFAWVYWYKVPIPYKKKVKRFYPAYINIDKVLKKLRIKEPELIDTESLLNIERVVEELLHGHNSKD